MRKGQVVQFPSKTREIADKYKNDNGLGEASKTGVVTEGNPPLFEEIDIDIDMLEMDDNPDFHPKNSAILLQIEHLFNEAVLPVFDKKIENEIIDGIHACAKVLLPFEPVYIASKMKVTNSYLNSSLEQQDSDYCLTDLIELMRKFYCLQFVFFTYVEMGRIRRVLYFDTFEDFCNKFNSWFNFSLEKTNQLKKIVSPELLVEFKSPHVVNFIDKKFK